MIFPNGKIIDAYKALTRLSDQPLPLALAWQVHKAKLALSPAMEFFCQQEEKAVLQCGGRIGDAGAITFAEPGDKARFLEKARELSALETDVDLTPILMDASALPPLTLSPNDLSALTGILRIREGDDTP